jgi:hypothetical protein
MAGLLVPWPSAECVNCRVLDLELCQADRVGSALQLLSLLFNLSACGFSCPGRLV